MLDHVVDVWCDLLGCEASTRADSSMVFDPPAEHIELVVECDNVRRRANHVTEAGTAPERYTRATSGRYISTADEGHSDVNCAEARIAGGAVSRSTVVNPWRVK